jgi:hypothetical protein
LEDFDLWKDDFEATSEWAEVKLSTHFCSFEKMPDKAKCKPYPSLKQYCFGSDTALFLKTKIVLMAYCHGF